VDGGKKNYDQDIWLGLQKPAEVTSPIWWPFWKLLSKACLVKRTTFVACGFCCGMKYDNLMDFHHIISAVTGQPSGQ
jgi:hypothetical protein